jgi:hypothetical protein
VETTLTRLETAYTVAEMYQELTGADVGICLAGGWSRSTNGYLYGGSITDASLECITPDKEPQEDDDSDANKIVTASLTGEQILSILNATSEADTKGLSIYYVAAGLTVEFAPWAGEGKRVQSCKLPDGSDLDPDAVYEVAYFNGSLPDDMTPEPDTVLDQTWQEAFLQWLDSQGDRIEKPDMTLTLVYE